MGIKMIWYCFAHIGDEKVNVKQKVCFTKDVKQPLEAGVMHTITEVTFFSFTKSTWIGDSSASCHITNNDTNVFDIINTTELI